MAGNPVIFPAHVIGRGTAWDQVHVLRRCLAEHMEARLAWQPSVVRKCLSSMEPKFVDAIPVVRGLRR
jgi:hypothetical protein